MITDDNGSRSEPRSAEDASDYYRLNERRFWEGVSKSLAQNQSLRSKRARIRKHRNSGQEKDTCESDLKLDELQYPGYVQPRLKRPPIQPVPPSPKCVQHARHDSALTYAHSSSIADPQTWPNHNSNPRAIDFSLARLGAFQRFQFGLDGIFGSYLIYLKFRDLFLAFLSFWTQIRCFQKQLRLVWQLF